MTVLSREDVEQQEHRLLAPQAAFADSTRGRETPLQPDPYRTEFQRDRDRIIHSKSFRRLSHKTQVFLAPEGDHYRTRLTHTLEVSQIARSVARTLRLNEDLTEAIALGHDLGHTPFAHTGEDAVTECLAGLEKRYPDVQVPFEHAAQSLRVVEVLEYEGKGLNLTWEVRDGIRRHTGDGRSDTLEGRIVAIADRIAYVNHDIDDALRGGVITESQLPVECTSVLGHNHGARIRTMVQDMVKHSEELEDVRMSEPVWNAMMELRDWLYDNVYTGSDAKREEPKAHDLVVRLFDHYMDHPDELPEEFAPRDPDQLPQAVVDYIAGMTDRFAIRTFERLFMPKNWRE